MEYRPDESKVSPSVRIAFIGIEEPATLLSLSVTGAQVLLLDRKPVWIGRFLALKIGKLPAIPGDIRTVDDLVLTVSFRSKLHETVFREACNWLEQQQSGNPSL